MSTQTEKESVKIQSQTRRRRQSSILVFLKARLSFVQSHGRRGASIHTLRGKHGAHFEGTALIHRGVTPSSIACLGFRNPLAYRNRSRYLLIKGPFCFVFEKETSKSPLYAIYLHGMTCKVLQQSKVSRTSVALTTSLGDPEYEIDFATNAMAQMFCKAIKLQATMAQSEEACRRLGREHAPTERSSLRYAKSIAQSKIQDEPTLAVSFVDLIKNMPNASFEV